MNKNKCPRCGIVNLRSDSSCRKCGAALDGVDAVADNSRSESEIPEQGKRRGVFRRLAWIAGVTVAILLIWYGSLIFTSEPLTAPQREMVTRAIEVLDRTGFNNEAFVLRNLVTYRGTDNWWNASVGHHEAYAATNFPFEVMTLYPQFFEGSTDDNERAAMLLHESYHLFGSGEETALEGVWRAKQRLGWTFDKYAQSQAWHGTRELTMKLVPSLFQCGPDGRSDCTN